jgi:hypothetical protein
MRRIILASAAAALLAAAPAFAQTQSERAAAAPNAGASGKVGVTTDGVVPNPPAVTGSGPVSADSTGTASTTNTTPQQTLDQRGVPKLGQAAGSAATSAETTTGAAASSPG